MLIVDGGEEYPKHFAQQTTAVVPWNYPTGPASEYHNRAKHVLIAACRCA